MIRSKGLGLPEDTGTESFVVVGFPEDTEGKEPAMVDGRNELELTKGGNVKTDYLDCLTSFNSLTITSSR